MIIRSFLQMLTSLFKGKSNEYQRADFEAVTEQWEKLVETLQRHLDVAVERITLLEIRLRDVQRESEECEHHRILDAKRITELEIKVGKLASEVHND